jgi:hypothetical protein
MTIVLNSTTGITTPPVSVQGSTSGTITLVAPAVAGDNTLTLLAATGTLSPFNSGTAQTAPFASPNTYADFTGIPNWVRRVTVMFSGISTSGTSNIQIQLGDSGGIEATGYLGVAVNYAGSGASNPSTGFAIASALAANLLSGHLVLTNISGNIWVASGLFGTSNTTFVTYTAGNKTLSDVLTQLRITTVNGTDTFDAGSVNVLYE